MATAKKRAYTVLAGNPDAVRVRADALVPNLWALENVNFAKADERMPARLILAFPSGDSLGIPLDVIPELKQATPRQLGRLELSPARDTIISEALDAYISVEGLVRDYAKQRSAFAERAAKVWTAYMGSQTSESKRKAAAANGKLGGRPRKEPERAVARAEGARPR